MKLQMLIDGQEVGQPMEYDNFVRWQRILKVQFPGVVIQARKVN